MVSVAFGTILKEYLSLLTHPRSGEEGLELLSSSVTGGEGEGGEQEKQRREGGEREGEGGEREKGDGREVKYRKEDRGREEVNRECVCDVTCTCKYHNIHSCTCVL